MALIRLINTGTLKLEEHWQSADDAQSSGKQYAILSHCWSENPSDEVSYQDLVGGGEVSRKKAYDKLRAFCALSSSLGYQYAWADTACINKDSATELSTALTSSQFSHPPSSPAVNRH